MKANILVKTEALSQQEWLNYRKQGIGGSDAAALCGLNPYKSPMLLWLEKTGQKEPVPAEEPAYWGKALEPLIREEFSKREKKKIQTVPAIIQHPQYPFMLANIDGIIIDPVEGNGILEIKTTSAYRSHRWEDKVPNEFMIQLQHYLAVTGLSYAYLALLIGGNEYKSFYIARDQSFITVLIGLERQFWSLVESKTPPPLDGSAATTEFIKELHPQSNGESITLPEEALHWISSYQDALEQEKKIKEHKDQAANHLKKMLGDAERGMIAGRKVSWKSIQSEKLNTHELKKEEPDSYSRYIQNSTYRRFTIR